MGHLLDFIRNQSYVIGDSTAPAVGGSLRDIVEGVGVCVDQGIEKAERAVLIRFEFNQDKFGISCA